MHSFMALFVADTVTGSLDLMTCTVKEHFDVIDRPHRLCHSPLKGKQDQTC